MMRVTQDGHMFPGRGRTLGSAQGQAVSDVDLEPNLQARLLDNSDSEHPSDGGQRLSDGRQRVNNTVAARAEIPVHHQDYVASEEEIQKLASMGFERVKNSSCASS